MNFASSENLIDSNEANIGEESYTFHDPSDRPLSEIEKTFLLHAERGDCATVKRIIQEYKEFTEEFDINCVDALSRSALVSAIENENIDLIKLLLHEGIAVKDGLLYAIKEEYVEAVEVLLVHEEKFHKPGEAYSWEKVDRSSSNFTPDMTPLILAAHKNNFEILKLLLDRGASLPVPHDVRCGCDDCVSAINADSLQHSKSRMNAYKALTSSSLIALSSSDPVLTAFELSWDLKRLSKMETEFRAEYNEMRSKVQTFAVSLLDHVRTSYELEVLLNHDPDGMAWDPGDHQSLERLKLAIKYKQKQFVAHPNVQQLLAAIWYEGLPGFKKKSLVNQLIQVAQIGMMFPAYCTMYLIVPWSPMGVFMKKPFVKFICHSSSYSLFLMLLGAASQRVEIVFLELFGNKWMQDIAKEWKIRERGTWPGLAECGVIIYVLSLIWAEISSLWRDGITEYIQDLWNILDFITNFFYVIWLVLRINACYITWREEREGLNPWYPREQWDIFEPMLISEGAFAAGMIFSFLKLVHIFSINPHLGPLQISLGRMIIDIIKFFFIYTLVLFAFGCGLNQLLWYYAELEKDQCYHLPSGLPDFENQDKACTIWRRYSNLFETSQSLFWASFGLVDLVSFDLTGIKGFTRFWALLMFGSYSVINVIVLLNMLIAMMSNSYQIISERADVEWKFARSRLWISYFDDGDTLPPPFNIIPKPKAVCKTAKCTTKARTKSFIDKSRENSKKRYNYVMKLLIRRYVTAEQRNRDDFQISEDDVMEIRQDISSLRYELVEILRQNGMTTPRISEDEVYLIGKKNKLMERRILKDFQIGLAGGAGDKMETFGKDTKDVFSQLVAAIAKKASKKKSKDWNELVRKKSLKSDPIGTDEEVQLAQKQRQSFRKKLVASSREESMEGAQTKKKKFPPLSRVIQLGRMERAQQLSKSMSVEKNDLPEKIVEENEKSNNSSVEKNEPVKSHSIKKHEAPKPPTVKKDSLIKKEDPVKLTVSKEEPVNSNNIPAIKNQQPNNIPVVKKDEPNNPTNPIPIKKEEPPKPKSPPKKNEPSTNEKPKRIVLNKGPWL